MNIIRFVDSKTSPVGGQAAQPASAAAGCASPSPLEYAQYRQREGLTSWLPVASVAQQWRITPRRVRALLCCGRLQGRQQENGYWEVLFPYTLTMGRRGPSMRKLGNKNPERKAEHI